MHARRLGPEQTLMAEPVGTQRLGGHAPDSWGPGTMGLEGWGWQSCLPWTPTLWRASQAAFGVRRPRALAGGATGLAHSTRSSSPGTFP